MSAKREQKAFCRIEDYLDAKYPKVAELIRATCVDMTLRSTRGKSGITLLLPTDPKFLEKVESKVYSDDPREASSACDMLNAVILRDCFKDAKSMKDAAAAGTLANSLYPAQKVEVKSAAGSKVEFANGATAELDKSFIDSSPKGNLAVWLLSGPNGLPVTKDSPATLAPRRKGPVGKVGSYQDDVQSQKLRYSIAVQVENEYALQKLLSSDSDPYCKRVSSLLDCVCEMDHDLFTKLAPLIHHSIVDFYVLVEPHRKEGYRIGDDILEKWWNGGRPAEVDCHKVWAKLDSVVGGLNRGPLREFAAEQRRQVAGAGGRPVARSVEDAYKSAAGLLAAISPLSGGYERMIVEDTLRYFCWSVCKGVFDIGAYNQMLQVIGDAMYSLNKDGDKYVSPILNKAQILHNVDPRGAIGLLMDFVNSSAFLGVPMTLDECKQSSGKVKNIHSELIRMAGDVKPGKHLDKNRILDSLRGQLSDEDLAKVAAAL